MMLQQTQVVRVAPKYKEFLHAFPTVKVLSQASLKEVLVLWQGLGYNSRAKRLHEAAKMVVAEYGGRFPKTYGGLLVLPGVGPYTAAAVCNIAYNTPVPTIETNVRTVLFHHLSFDRGRVSDTELLALAEELLDTKKPREWLWALMDYGAYLKSTGVKTNSKSIHYTKQTKFKGSNRELRGAIVRVLGEHDTCTVRKLARFIERDVADITQQLNSLHKEGIVQKKKNTWSL